MNLVVNNIVFKIIRRKNIKNIKYEVKFERSVKVIFGVFAIGVFLNAFQTPIAQEVFGIKSAFADLNSWDSLEVWIKNWPR
tara:strand:- start:261 stop:503 length:243 start_codon:yes stop_codon:yes gene_type:complete